MNVRRTLTGVLASLALFGAACHATQNHASSSSSAMHAGAGALDGKVYAVELGEKGKSKGDPDNLEFRNGAFHSTACDAYGFGTAPYMAKASGSGTAFDAVTTNAQGGRMTWHGTVTGDMVEGSALGKMPDGSTTQYWFRGKRSR